MSHFRDRVILTPGNIPQLQSGRVKFVIGSYSISTPYHVIDTLVCGVSISTALGAVNIYTIAPPTADLGALIPTSAISVHSP